MSTVITEDEAKENIAARLSACLEEKGWTQGDLARAIQIDGEELQAARMRVSRYVQGKSMPPVDILSNMAELLDVTVDFLLSPIRRKKSSKSA
jgi:transcriptional regulator with XRE-family HTH domain